MDLEDIHIVVLTTISGVLSFVISKGLASLFSKAMTWFKKK